jgi:hypothetical protein
MTAAKQCSFEAKALLALFTFYNVIADLVLLLVFARAGQNYNQDRQ